MRKTSSERRVRGYNSCIRVFCNRDMAIRSFLSLFVVCLFNCWSFSPLHTRHVLLRSPFPRQLHSIYPFIFSLSVLHADSRRLSTSASQGKIKETEVDEDGPSLEGISIDVHEKYSLEASYCSVFAHDFLLLLSCQREAVMELELMPIVRIFVDERLF